MCGRLSPKVFQIRPMVDLDNPVSAAIEARDHCVASLGAGPFQRGHHQRLDLLVGNRERSARARLVD
jgi:hypothetical protein